MILVTLEAFVALIAFDVVAKLGFGRVHRLMGRCPCLRRRGTPDTIAQVCAGVDEACIWYFRRVLCLQRSAVTMWLLRLHGVDAGVVIGFRPVPLDSHAWVEVDGRVVNDHPQYQKFFRVLERF